MNTPKPIKMKFGYIRNLLIHETMKGKPFLLLFLPVFIMGLRSMPGVHSKSQQVLVDLMQPFDKYWAGEHVAMDGNVLLLNTVGSGIISKFSARNFNLNLRIMTTGSGEGYVHFHLPDSGKSSLTGYRVIINSSDYRSGGPQKTGSLWRIRNNFVRTSMDDTWFDLSIAVKANTIQVTVNGKTVSEYIEPPQPVRMAGCEQMKLGTGVIAVYKTSTMGVIRIKQMEIEMLPDDLPRQPISALASGAIGDALTLLNQKEFPVIDFHGHLKGGLTVEQVTAHGRAAGYNYGLSPNCGLHFPVTNDSSLFAWFQQMSPEPVFKAMQCEGREWVALFSPKEVARFDYIFTDAMTWTDHKGRRMRLWMPEETWVEDKEQFMDMLVDKIVAIVSHEPVDIHVNPTYLPASIAEEYDQLWTPERMERVINALKEYDVALEINARFRIPSVAFVNKARAAGVKFTFGTNNGGSDDLNRLEYCLEMIESAGLEPADMFIPRPQGAKKILFMGLPAKITG